MFLAFLISEPNWAFCKAYSLYMGYSLGKMPDSKTSHFSNIWCFFEQLSEQSNSNVIKQSFIAFFSIFNLWAKLTIFQSL